MDGEIKNRVAESKLVTVNPEDYYTPGVRSVIDLAQWLEEGIILREKPFREAVGRYDFSVYQNHHVALLCSTEAIVPVWAFMVVTSKLQGISQTVVLGDLNLLETHLYEQALSKLDFSAFTDKNVMVKGCFNKPVPQSAYVTLTAKLQKVARAVFYGEACSSVPVYKAAKKQF